MVEMTTGVCLREEIKNVGREKEMRDTQWLEGNSLSSRRAGKSEGESSHPHPTSREPEEEEIKSCARHLLLSDHLVLLHGRRGLSFAF